MTKQLRDLLGLSLLCFVLIVSTVFAEARRSGLPVSIDLLPTRQLVIGYDLTQGGRADYWTSHALVEFLPGPASCPDHDRQYLLIATDGFYRVRAAPDLQRMENGDWHKFNPATEQPKK